MEIREYQPEDCKVFAELFYDTVHSVNARHYTQQQLEAWADGKPDIDAWDESFRRHYTLTALIDGKIAGFGDVDDTGYLDRLYVHRDYQGRGVASALCSMLESRYPDNDITAHASITARPFFEKRGYRMVKEQQVERKGTMLTNFVMVKPALSGITEVTIRSNIDSHMKELKNWLSDTQDVKLEEMSDFFKARLGEYEEHMAVWKKAYEYMGQIVPGSCRNILDLGCGTGLEIDEIRKAGNKGQITGIDMSEDMLGLLQQKHKDVHTICADYFQYDLGSDIYDAAVSFESLHHFKPEKKEELFKKIYRSLRQGGIYIEADYIACCEEEEELLMEVCDSKRKKDQIPDNVFVHFDTPLTAGHEMELLRNAGFEDVHLVCSIEGAAFITGIKR